ncbi:YhcB family protein [Kaarinaea lacus]
MFGEISLLAWMGGAIMFAIGGAAGFFISRQMKDKRTQELEEKLAATRTELSDYRGEVNQHFLKTSLLVSKLTNDYREVYEHLATGAQKLCNEKPGTPKLDLPDTKILTASESAADSVNTGHATIGQDTETVEASSETAIEAQEVETGSDRAKEKMAAQDASQPAPEDIPNRDEGDEEVPLGAESTPGVDVDPHKTHPSLH